MACPTENELLEYASGQRRELDAHVKGCSSCTALLGAAFSDPGLGPTDGGADALVGARLGEYVVDARIGQGGMGIVYKGRQPIIGKTVAIKVIRPEVAAEDPLLVKRLLGEARAANAIGHHGIIDIFSFGETPQGQHYFVMEYLVGEPLSELVRRRGKLSQAETITLLESFLGPLSSAHAAGVVHRDLKPSNLFLVHQPDGSRFVKVLDFGLAKLPAAEGPGTAPGVMLGTPEYMAPEQIRASKTAGPRADLYSVGVIAFQLLTGRTPYRAEAAQEVVELVLEAPVPRVSSLQPRVHPRFDELVYRLMKKRAEERPAAVEEVRRELAAIKRVVEATESGAQSTDAAMAPTELVSALGREQGFPDDDEAPPPRKRRWPWVAAALVVVLGAGSAGAWWWLTTR